jgi:hypothetical protein
MKAAASALLGVLLTVLALTAGEEAEPREFGRV